MKFFIVILFTFILSVNGFSQVKFPIEIRVEKQAMCTPMGPIDEAFFTNYYIMRPVNIKFDGSQINMVFDDGTIMQRLKVKKVRQDAEVEDNQIITEKITYTSNSNSSDTISLVIDHQFGMVQFIMPSKNSKGGYWGYTSFRQYINQGELASK
jgi:hypothetical protein